MAYSKSLGTFGRGDGRLKNTNDNQDHAKICSITHRKTSSGGRASITGAMCQYKNPVAPNIVFKINFAGVSRAAIDSATRS